MRQVRVGRQPEQRGRVSCSTCRRRAPQRLLPVQPVPPRHRLRARAARRSRAAARSRRASDGASHRGVRGRPQLPSNARRPRPRRPPRRWRPSGRRPAPHRHANAPNAARRASRCRASSASASRGSSSIPGMAATIPGAQVRGLNEAELVLDIALRLEKLLDEGAGRRGRADAPDQRLRPARGAHGDRQPSAAPTCSSRFTPTPATTRRARRRDLLPELRAKPRGRGDRRARERRLGDARCAACRTSCKAIALNNKIDESRDFAAMVQAVDATSGCGRRNRSAQEPRRQAGAVHGAHRRDDAERAGGDLVPHATSRKRRC